MTALGAALGSLGGDDALLLADFPPLFLRFLARTTGPNGPAGHDLQLVNEQSIDTFLVNIKNIASDDFTVELAQ